MDPQQRMFLQEAWRAFEDAGYAAEELSGSRCAVFVGSMMNEYHDLLTHRMALTPRAHEVTGVACYIPGRVAYHLNLRGPAIAIDTASSSSLVAIHMAARALQTGEADMALAGGVSLFLTEKRIRVLGSAGILAAEGRCRPFDDAAQGTLAAEGIAAVVLKRLDDAIADGDAIYGVIRGSGMNQSGHTPGGITVPSVDSQVELMRQVYRDAGIEPATIQYAEAHGTGTLKGDPIEAAALAAAIGDRGRRTTPCHLSSIKANFGHGFAAAGVGSLIKVLLALQRRTIPPQINFSTLNRRIDQSAWPFTISTKAVAWEANGAEPRRAAVSGIGLTGTNCHCVVDEPAAAAPREADPPSCGVWMVLSARTESAVRQRATDLRAWLQDEGAGCALIDLGFTLSVGRTAFTERLAFLAKSHADVEAGLGRFLGSDSPPVAPELFRGVAPAEPALASAAATDQFEQAGHAWVRGAAIAWRTFFEGTQPRRLHLPTYPFEGVPTWYDLQGGVPLTPPAPAKTATTPVAPPMPLPVTAKPPEAAPKNSGPVKLKVLSRAAAASPVAVAPPSSSQVTVERPAAAAPVGIETPRAGTLETRARLRSLVAQTLFVKEERVQEASRFVDLGLDSILAVELTKSIRATFGVSVSAARLYDYSTTIDLAGHIDHLLGGGARSDTAPVSGFEAAATQAPEAPAPRAAIAPVTLPAAGDIQSRLRSLVARTLFVPTERVSENVKFADLGLDSILAVELTKAIKPEFGVSVPTARLYDFPTVIDLAGFIAQQLNVATPAVTAVAPAVANVHEAPPAPAAAAPAVSSEAAANTLLPALVALIASTLYVDQSKINPDTTFTDLGLDSILAVELVKKVSLDFGVKLTASALYDHVSPRRLAAHLADLKSAGRPVATAPVLRPTSGFEASVPMPRPVSVPSPVPAAPKPVVVASAAANRPPPVAAAAGRTGFTPIAIVGYSGRFPGASTPEELWQLLCAGKSVVSTVPEARRALGDNPENSPAPGEAAPGSRWGAFLDGIDEFDAGFFNLAPAEAERMDPQHRAFLQEAWRALEHAGYSPVTTAGRRCGVFIGLSPSDYGHYVPELDAQTYAGNSPSALPARVAYLLNWHGPTMAIDTACASTFSALDLACASLGRRESDLMMVGGVHVTSGSSQREVIARMGLLSPQGRCRSFDAAADGWVLGEAAGALILKRLDDAERDGDTIHAVVRACGVNQDGAKNGLLAPHSAWQRALQKQIYAEAGISPETIDYVEVHGTGTVLSDEVELLALNDSFRAATAKAGYCAISTLKPNIGHSMAAAGMTCLIKVLLSLKHRAITPIIGPETPNPALQLEGGPFFLNTQLRAWTPTPGRPRRAAVNGQSALGANCHVILEEWTPANDLPPARAAAPAAPVVLILSAQSAAQLRESAAALARALEPMTDADLRSVAFTLQTGRLPMAERLAFVASSVVEARAVLTDFAAGRARDEVHHRRCDGIDPGIAMLVDGTEGAQFIAASIAAGSLGKLARLWVHGVAIDWKLLHTSQPPRRIPLPTYPFARDRYWLQVGRDQGSRRSLADAAQHPGTAPDGASGPMASPLAAPGASAVLLAIITRLLRATTGSVTLDGEIARSGFNSLYVLRAADRFAATTGKRIPNQWFFECRTIREIGERVERELGATSPGAALALDEKVSITGKNGAACAAGPALLSEGQKALWRFQQAHPKNRAYHVPIALRWEGRIHGATLERTLAQIAREQPALLAAFQGEGNDVRQHAGRSGSVPLLRERVDSEAALAQRLRELGEAPFDLRNGPLWRAAVISAPAGDVLHVTFHHLVFDGHSLGLFFERLEEIYASGATRDPHAIMPTGAGAHFAENEAAYLATDHAKNDRAFWLARFPQGFAPVLPATIPSRGEADGALVVNWIPAETVGTLRAYAAAHRVTVQGVLLAAYLAHLADEFGHAQITTGVAADLRTTEEELATIGYFVNVLPVAANVSREETFGPFCQRVFAGLLDALDHRRFPFRQLARALAGKTGDPRACELETGFYFQSWLAGVGQTLGRRMIPEVHQTGEFPLAFEVIELEGDWRLNVKFRPAVWSRERAQRSAEQFIASLGRIGARPDATIGDVLTPAPTPASTLAPQSAPEATRTTPAADDVTFVYPDCCVHELFQQQVERAPQAIAAKFRESSLDYASLEARANRLTHQLVARGVRPGALVAVSLRRSLDLLVGLLAVWKAGAAYVPVDPAYPEDRIAAIVGDSEARFFLTHRDVPRRPEGVIVIDCDAERAEIESRSSQPPAVAHSSRSLAYVIYTSGSTGRPKGVQVSQRNLVHFLSCMARRPGCGPSDRVLALTTICFDIAALELYLPLVTGACVEIAPEDLTRNGARLRAKLEDGSVTLVQATPATWKMLLAAELGPVPHLRALCGGEAWDAELAGQLLQRVRQLWNMYGPTETTVWSSIAEVRAGEPIRLGDPIGNTQFYVLDEELKPVPKGEVGELFIGGDGVAVGYHNNPTLNDERFIIVPHLANRRVYRTGDLVRYV